MLEQDAVEKPELGFFVRKHNKNSYLYIFVLEEKCEKPEILERFLIIWKGKIKVRSMKHFFKLLSFEFPRCSRILRILKKLFLRCEKISFICQGWDIINGHTLRFLLGDYVPAGDIRTEAEKHG